MKSNSGKFFDNCKVKNFNFSTFQGDVFARKVEVSMPNFYFSSSSEVEKWMAKTGFLSQGTILRLLLREAIPSSMTASRFKYNT